MFDDLPDLPAAVRNEQVDKELEKERRAAIKLASIVALVPPAFTLALGLALVWAFRGFR
jgi:hypothetical protein